MTNPTIISQMARMPSFAPVKNEQVHAAKCGTQGTQNEAPEGQSEEMQGLLKQLGSMIQANMMMTMMRLNQTMSGMGGMGGMGGMMGGMGGMGGMMGGMGGMAAMQQLSQLSMLQNMLQQVQDMQGGEEPPPAYGDTGAPPPDYQSQGPQGGGKTECGKPGQTTEATKPTGPEVSPDQAKINDEKLRGAGNHTLGPDDQLLPAEDKGKSMDELKKSGKYDLVKNLGNQEGIRDKLKSVVGDIDNDPQAMARGQAYLQKIKNMPNPDGSERPDKMKTNNKIEGCTKDGDIRSGTEAAMLKDSFKGGAHVSDKNAPNPPKAEDAYKWMNEQKALAPTKDKHVVNGGNGRSDAQVFFMNVGDNIKKGFEKIGDGFVKIGEGIKNFAEGAVKAIGGAFKVVGGALTFNPDLIKEGANNVADGAKGAWKAVDTTITGAGQVLGGAASVAVSVSPAGMAINQMTGNAASRLASGVFEGMADTVVKGRNGLINVADGIMKGDMKQALKGGLDFVNLASMFVPGAGQANLARNIAQNAGKELVKDGVKGSVKDEAVHQYKENKNDGTQQA
jgi:hypothetical protein